MNNLAQRTFIGCIQLIIGLAVLLFVPAWTFDFWQAWVYLFIFGISVAVTLFYLNKNDPKLLERRLNRAEKEKSQQWIQRWIYLLYVLSFIVPSLDHRLMWSSLPWLIVVMGDILMALGYLIIFFTLKENTFAAATVEVSSDQKVISTGPYAIVRHPMYAGAIVMLGGTPLALGSWWGLLIFIPLTCAITWRLLNEEAFLSQNLTGYKQYRQKVPHRLIPFIW